MRRRGAAILIKLRAYIKRTLYLSLLIYAEQTFEETTTVPDRALSARRRVYLIHFLRGNTQFHTRMPVLL